MILRISLVKSGEVREGKVAVRGCVNKPCCTVYEEGSTLPGNCNEPQSKELRYFSINSGPSLFEGSSQGFNSMGLLANPTHRLHMDLGADKASRQRTANSCNEKPLVIGNYRKMSDKE